MALRNWHFRRIVTLSLLWIVIAFGVRVVRSIAFAREVQARQPGGDFYVVLLPLPGGVWALLGPPVVLMMACSPCSDRDLPANVALQPTSARASEGLRLSAWRDASALKLVSRILSRPLAAELER